MVIDDYFRDQNVTFLTNKRKKECEIPTSVRKISVFFKIELPQPLSEKTAACVDDTTIVEIAYPTSVYRNKCRQKFE